MTKMTIMMILLLTFPSQSPFMMILLLIMFTIIMTINTINILYSSWLPMIIFIMMIGGLMILFIYMASLIPNKKLMLIPKNFFVKALFMSTLMILTNLNIPLLEKSSLSPLLMVNYPILMTFSVTILLIMLIFINMIIKKNQGPLRTM